MMEFFNNLADIGIFMFGLAAVFMAAGLWYDVFKGR